MVTRPKPRERDTRGKDYPVHAKYKHLVVYVGGGPDKDQALHNFHQPL